MGDSYFNSSKPQTDKLLKVISFSSAVAMAYLLKIAAPVLIPVDSTVKQPRTGDRRLRETWGGHKGKVAYFDKEFSYWHELGMSIFKKSSPHHLTYLECV